MMNLIEAAQATGGVLTGSDDSFEDVGTDTRGVLARTLFVALRGERFDGHSFIAQAAEAGAAAAMVERDIAVEAPPGFPLLKVDNTRLALGRLAAHWRRKFSLPVIGVTGSNGKTTVKEMCAAILRAAWPGEGAVLATQGNLNNDIGLPQMLLRLTAGHRAAVFEMGMNRPGEIGYLASLAAPGVAVVTNAQRAHLAGMGELAAVATEKGAIFGALDAQGIAAINADDTHAALWRQLAGPRRIVTFGLTPDADVTATHEPMNFGSRIALRSPAGEASIALRVPGVHNVRNALAAAATTLAAGVPLAAVVAGLEGFGGAKGRLQIRAANGGAVLLDDTYNANPDSVRAGIDVLGSAAGRKILVLGDMGEIGEMSAQYHDEVGGYAKSQGVDQLLALGDQSALAARNFGVGGEHFASVDELVTALRPMLKPDVVVLVKGSRFMRMERVADAVALPTTETKN
ncbi:MAG: UDP-N-acetylmuramoyl-tripeptide--D-alanyl-D-alanine ligase [Moraxellaceae bacterium]|nr:UDP-N-acetylmuramoyl-tripeptide--D-alanyl-D-alanine ligase [Moraxellaceae bacterium]